MYCDLPIAPYGRSFQQEMPGLAARRELPQTVLQKRVHVLAITSNIQRNITRRDLHLLCRCIGDATQSFRSPKLDPLHHQTHRQKMPSSMAYWAITSVTLAVTSLAAFTVVRRQRPSNEPTTLRKTIASPRETLLPHLTPAQGCLTLRTCFPALAMLRPHMG